MTEKIDMKLSVILTEKAWLFIPLSVLREHLKIRGDSPAIMIISVLQAHDLNEGSNSGCD